MATPLATPATWPESLASFSVTASAYLAAHYEPSVKSIAACILVFSRDRILLLRRALTDTMPGLWEPAGGGVEDDESLLAAAQRELKEETGLSASHIVRVVSEGKDEVPGSLITDDKNGTMFVKFAFEVDVEGEGEPVINLNPEEHDEYVWATEDEVMGDRFAGFTGWTRPGTKKFVVNGFRLRQEGKVA